MTSEAFHQRLECIGWKILGGERHRKSGHWCLFAYSCGHTIVVITDSRKEAWSAACSMAMKLTRHGLVGTHE